MEAKIIGIVRREGIITGTIVECPYDCKDGVHVHGGQIDSGKLSHCWDREQNMYRVIGTNETIHFLDEKNKGFRCQCGQIIRKTKSIKKHIETKTHRENMPLRRLLTRNCI